MKRRPPDHGQMGQRNWKVVAQTALFSLDAWQAVILQPPTPEEALLNKPPCQQPLRVGYQIHIFANKILKEVVTSAGVWDRLCSSHVR